MSDSLRPVRGMKDLMPEEFLVHDHIIRTSKEIGECYGFKSFSSPIVEYTGVFARTLGDESDVVSKEMYSFPDKGGDSLTLRPEFTAGVMRSVISNKLQSQLPLKLFSYGPVFRYDRPQKGRYRQFNQINFEALGVGTPESDAEIIALAQQILTELEIDKQVTLELNSLGCLHTKQAYQKALFEYFTQYEAELSEDSKRRLHKNPMRILDSKDKQDQKIGQDAPLMSAFYSKEAEEYFNKVRSSLELLDINYSINPKLVRGLDYYSHTAFEFTTNSIDAERAITILAGGRYDGLAEIMGSKPFPAIGFAAGIERLALMREFTLNTSREVAIIPIGDENFEVAFKLANTLRQNKIAASIYSQGKVGKRMQAAVKANSKYAIIMGSDEIAQGVVKFKKLDAEEEVTLAFDDLVNECRK